MKKRTPVTVILDNIRSALNVGAIFRTCDAANIQKLYLCGITAYPPHNRIPKTALGAIEHVPWQYCQTVKQAIKEIDNKGACSLALKTTLISVETEKSAVDFWDYQFPFPCTLIFGNEISGISQKNLKKSDAIIQIPMFGRKESLNIATACGVSLYELLRQWRRR